MKLAKNNRSILIIIAMALVLSLSVGMTFAYFNDQVDTAAKAKLTLGGKTEIVEEYDEESKTVKIKNIGETDVLVRVGIYGATEIKIEAEGDWTDEINGFYYYTKILPVGGTTSEITATITSPEGEIENFDVVVVNECMQVTYNPDNTIFYPDGWAKGFIK